MNRVTPQFAIAMAILAVIFLLMLSGCSAKTESVTSNYVLPPELQAKGCKIYKMSGSSGTSLYVVDCPNSNVSVTNPAKNGTRTATLNSGPAEQPASAVELVQEPEVPQELNFRGHAYVKKN